MERTENQPQIHAGDRQNVILIGFMGCGKTTVGEKLAQSLGFEFIDTDHEIEARAGMLIPEIFAESGESGFRKVEKEVLESLADVSGKVIATGGGIVMNDDNVRRLREIGYVIWLDVTEEAIWERVAGNRHRPLLQTENPRQTVHDLLGKRRPVYRAAAHFAVETSGLSQEEVLHGITTEVRVHFAA